MSFRREPGCASRSLYRLRRCDIWPSTSTPTEPLASTSPCGAHDEANRALSYWAMRRILQRANKTLGTDWTLHDLRHTAATRMANDPALTLTEVQAILRHADIETTGRYTRVRVEELFDKLQEHYNRPRSAPVYTAGYADEDIRAVFGG